MIRILAATLLAALSVQAAAQTPPAPVRLRGTVEKLENLVMTVKSRDGSTVDVKLAENYAVVGVSRAKLEDMSKGKYIGTTTLGQKDGALVALEVHIFPEAMRGTGDGHRGWDLQPSSTMTNGAVEQTSASSDGQVLMLKYKDGEKKIVVTPDTPIVTYVPGEKSELKPGAPIFIAAATKLPDGTLQTPRVNVGRGVVPPM